VERAYAVVADGRGSGDIMVAGGRQKSEQRRRHEREGEREVRERGTVPLTGGLHLSVGRRRNGPMGGVSRLAGDSGWAGSVRLASERVSGRIRVRNGPAERRIGPVGSAASPVRQAGLDRLMGWLELGFEFSLNGLIQTKSTQFKPNPSK
jgi:hypothetical protein